VTTLTQRENDNKAKINIGNDKKCLHEPCSVSQADEHDGMKHLPLATSSFWFSLLLSVKIHTHKQNHDKIS